MRTTYSETPNRTYRSNNLAVSVGIDLNYIDSVLQFILNEGQTIKEFRDIQIVTNGVINKLQENCLGQASIKVLRNLSF